LAAQIASAYLEAHPVAAAALPGLLRDIHRTLKTLDQDAAAAAGQADTARGVAVNPQKSVFSDHLVCLGDGAQVTMLKHHLQTAHGLTPEQYRAKWRLPPHYPMVAPN
jgi:predicted transcriptional regulator